MHETRVSSGAGDPSEFEPDDTFRINGGFHEELIDLSANKLLIVAAQPLFAVLRTHLRQDLLTPEDHTMALAGHETIVQAIQAGDEVAAAAAMRSHIEDLRPVYERAWRPGH